MNPEIIFQLLLAMILGALIGLEREKKGKGAGLQTYSLVTLGTCLFTLLSFEIVQPFLSMPGINIDLIRIVQAIAIGIGFIGAGVIFHQEPSGVVGVTTAAGLWVAAAIGIAVGAGFYLISIVATLLTLFIFIVFGELEKKFFQQ